jgi:hypothetical protein
MRELSFSGELIPNADQVDPFLRLYDGKGLRTKFWTLYLSHNSRVRQRGVILMNDLA